MLSAYNIGENMKEKGLGKHINDVRKDQGFTSDKLSEMCSINATYLRQIESGVKIPSLPVFIDICNALNISPDYLLQDDLVPNEITTIRELADLWENASPHQQEMAASMIRAALIYDPESQ